MATFTKPGSLPRMAATAADPNTPVNTTAPLSSQQDTGYAAGDPLPAQILNWFLQLIYQWLGWLSQDDTRLKIGTDGGSLSSGVTVGTSPTDGIGIRQDGRTGIVRFTGAVQVVASAFYAAAAWPGLSLLTVPTGYTEVEAANGLVVEMFDVTAGTGSYPVVLTVSSGTVYARKLNGVTYPNTSDSMLINLENLRYATAI